MFGFFNESQFESRIKQAVREVIASAINNVDSTLSKLKDAAALTAEVVKLKEDVETLRIEKGRKEEEFARKEREIEHKVGLERKRQEFEIGAAKREATLTVREENLAADRKRFEDQMQFHEKRFTEEVTYLKDMIGQVMERLPNISAEVTPKRRK